MIEFVVQQKETPRIDAERFFDKARKGGFFTPYERDLLVKTIMSSPDMVGTISSNGMLPDSPMFDFRGSLVLLRLLSNDYGILYDDGVSLFKKVPGSQIRLEQHYISTAPNSRHAVFFGPSFWQLLPTETTISGYVERHYDEPVRFAANMLPYNKDDFVKNVALGIIFDRTIRRVRKIE